MTRRLIPVHLIEADPAQTHRGLLLASRLGDDHDRFSTVEHRAGPRCVLAAQRDIDAAGNVSFAILRRIADIQNLRSRIPQF